MKGDSNNLPTNGYQEFAKLDDVDQKVALWIIDNLNGRGIKSWIEFIAVDYKRRNEVHIDAVKLFAEMQDGMK